MYEHLYAGQTAIIPRFITTHDMRSADEFDELRVLLVVDVRAEGDFVNRHLALDDVALNALYLVRLEYDVL